MSLNQFSSPTTYKPDVSLNKLSVETELKLNNLVSGYTPTNLNYYENAVQGVAISGLTNPITTVINITRIGNLVTVQFPEIIDVGAGTAITISSAIPTRFRPLNNLNFYAVVVDGTAVPAPPNQSNGHVDLIASNGNIIIYRTPNELSFNNLATAGYRSFTISYLVGV